MEKLSKVKEKIYPWISPKERLSALRRLRGMWKNRKPNPLRELEKMRREWDNTKRR